jgi:3-hydroxymyristoyl/3-hydroxydecanoyl-(acyl carrier protein) dehydratase
MDIERYMDGPTRTDSIMTSSFMFPSEFIGFQGHFPTNKVLPGACQIQCAITTIEKALEKRVVLKEIMLAKYTAPVFPGDKVICTVSGVPDTGFEFIYKARITKGAEKVTDLKLRVSLSDAI